MIGGKPDFGVEEVLRRARLVRGRRAVRFMGLIPDADLPAFYGGAACFVYPSLFEGFGLPLDRGHGVRHARGDLGSLGHAGGGR